MEAARRVGEPITQKDAAQLADYLASMKAETVAKTQTEKELVAA